MKNNLENSLKKGTMEKENLMREFSLVNGTIEKELSEMINAKIIKNGGTHRFINSLVMIRKPNGSLRICLDPQYLNSNIFREHFYLPVFENIASKMAGAQVFSISDANNAFWQIKLSEESSKLTTFDALFGRFVF